MQTIQVMPKGEIKLPMGIIGNLGVKPGEKLEVRIKNRQVILSPIKGVADELWGSIKCSKEEIEEVIDMEVGDF
ncbi:MAG: hypothetical protein QME42_10250 [bacterium]|nr:hypothetical protein [bacterium]